MTPMPDPIDRGWFYVVEPRPDAVPAHVRVEGRDGRTLSKRPNGFPGWVLVEGGSRAEQLRAAAAAGAAMESLGDPRAVRLLLGDGGTDLGIETHRVEPCGDHHAAEETLREALREGDATPLPTPPLGAPTARVLFFESLMNTDMPHNDRELSQGVLHMASGLADLPTEVVLANVKMAITGDERPAEGLETLRTALAGGPIGLVCISLLEGYFVGVEALIATLRELGCRARIAVGGVMPTLNPEHVAAHLGDVSFVCRGAGEGFVPQLVRIVGDTDVDTPLSDAQVAQLMALDGLIALDHGRLIAANTAQIVQVDDLDATALDLTLLEKRHVEAGIEIATSRGCIHRCSFCSIIGRETYQARSSEGIIELLNRYEHRIRELTHENPGPDAFRVHISDDDFACDLPRAIAFLQALPSTPFRLASFQVSIADLCVHEGNRLLPQLDQAFLDALDPALFADHGRPIPASDFVHDHKSRDWSSYLQIGVETFSNKELVRLAKGYRVEHIRAAVAALSARGIHMDAYFIVANTDTTADELVDSVAELSRLKLRHPLHFHLRFPIVPRLVSYFPSVTHRRKLRAGRADSMALRDTRSLPGFPEFDYPFVDYDVPDDPWVADLDGSFLTDEGRYTESLNNLHAAWSQRWESTSGDERLHGERLLRRVDDLPRRLAFDHLSEARRTDREPAALSDVTELLGPADSWVRAFARHDSPAPPRLVVIPTWQCELRCTYCYIPKQDGRVMSADTMQRSLDFLLSSERDDLTLQFFGGEALMEWELVSEAIRYGTERAAELKKQLTFIVSSNGFSLTPERLEWLRDKPVKLELSLDGTPEHQNRFRRAWNDEADSYVNGIAHRHRAIVDSGLDHEVIMVVPPAAAGELAANFFHIADLGFRSIQINFALGLLWHPKTQKQFADSLLTIGRELRGRWARGDDLMLVNVESPPMPIRLNGEITVDFDGTIYGGNGFLQETDSKDLFRIGHLDEHGHFDRYWMDAPTNEFLLEHTYKAKITANNLKVGRVLTSFIEWMQREPIGVDRRVIDPRIDSTGAPRVG